MKPTIKAIVLASSCVLGLAIARPALANEAYPAAQDTQSVRQDEEISATAQVARS